MLIAHPDDEILFGYSDIYYNYCTIICFTNKNNKIRSNEFNECMNNLLICNNIKNHIMLPLIDSMKNNWCGISSFNPPFAPGLKPGRQGGITNEYIYNKYINEIIKDSVYDLIISHDSEGEYGHIQHIRVNNFAKYLGLKLNVQFIDFKQRNEDNIINETMLNERKLLLNIYKSQKTSIQLYENFYKN